MTSGRAVSERVKVTTARGGEDGFDNFLALDEIGVGSCNGPPHPAHCSVRELCRRGRRALPHELSDLVEGHVEHVMQHERQPLGGSKCFEHNEQRLAHGVGQGCFLLGIDPVLSAHDGFGHERVNRLLAPPTAPSQHVQADAPHDRRQPSAQVRDTARIGAVQPQPGFLSASQSFRSSVTCPRRDPSYHWGTRTDVTRGSR
jgi:hypothetical protein